MSEQSHRPEFQGRRNFLINPKFQIAFMGYTVGIAFATIAVFWLADFYFFTKFRHIGQSLVLSKDHVFFQFIREQENSKNLIYLSAALISFVGLSFWGLFLSHRVAGPLYRLCKHFSSVAKGETLDDVRFREGDFFPEVADGFNLQMKRYRELSAGKGSSGEEKRDESKAA